MLSLRFYSILIHQDTIFYYIHLGSLEAGNPVVNKHTLEMYTKRT